MSLMSVFAGKPAFSTKAALSAAVLATVAATLSMGVATPAQAQYAKAPFTACRVPTAWPAAPASLPCAPGPSATAPMIHQLFNGDTVEITDRRGSWYFAGGDGFEGWAHRKWMSNSCGY